MRRGCVSDFIDTLHDCVECCVVTDGSVCSVQVVVNCSG